MIDVRPFEFDDLELGFALSSAAGWNQLPADWRRIWQLDPDFMFVGMLDGRAVATVTACRFESVAWVGMLLVDPAVRGRGLGRALMQRVLAELAQRNVATIRLDATPLGQPLYERLGFRVDYTLSRYAGIASTGAAAELDEVGIRVAPMAPSMLAAASELDAAVTATQRGRLLARLYDEWPTGAHVALRGERVVGFALRRAGRLGTLIGPCLGDAAAGGLLLSHALQQLAGQQVLVDIPNDHRQARALVTARDLRPVRPLTRMSSGRSIGEDPGRIWASSGPEKG